MKSQNQISYNYVAQAIEYIKLHPKSPINLTQLATVLNLEPATVQRIFKEWAGTNLQEFFHYIRTERLRKVIKTKHATLFDALTEDIAVNTSTLQGSLVQMDKMTSIELNNGAEKLRINYSFTTSQWGGVIVASTAKGICYLAFEDEKNKAFQYLLAKFPKANFHNQQDLMQQNALQILNDDTCGTNEIKLHVKGTDFQLNVWKTLLNIPFGGLSTYGKLAEMIGAPNASRAVGTAIGSNPVAYVIPCHRVIQSTGKLGGYRWGNIRKTAMIAWEAAKVNTIV